ncbi:MAG: transketolase C-terminal domain-containing protein, partial [Protaetiibacter sp.]
VGDGDLMEGVALEATALAGRLGLGKLIVYYDDNDVVIDGRASVTHSADGVCASLAAYGWQVSEPVDGNDLDALEAATDAALADTARPSLIRVRTRIGFGSTLEDDPVIHSGAVSDEEVAFIKAGLGVDLMPGFEVPADVRASWKRFAVRGAGARAAWNEEIETYGRRHPVGAGQLRRWTGTPEPLDVAALVTERPTAPEPVRASSGAVLNALAGTADNLVGGAADLAHATFAHLTDGGTYGVDDRGARNIAYGIREHAMGAISNGIALHGLFRPFASTFMVFAGYEANALRMAALQELPVIHVLSHDSITVGEDGPTHQPIETFSLLRATPNTLVLRPADFEETVAAWQLALDNLHGPTVLAVARTAVPQLDHSRQLGSAARGGYVLAPAADSAGPDVVIAASGLEVGLAVDAAALLRERGVDAAVVSLPSHELFLAQDSDYRDAVLPPDVPRLIVEASHPLSLWRLAGPLGAVYGIDRFGASAPPAVLLEQYGFTPEAIADAASAQLSVVLQEVAR